MILKFDYLIMRRSPFNGGFDWTQAKKLNFTVLEININTGGIKNFLPL